VAFLLLAVPAAALEVPETRLSLEVSAPLPPGFVAAALPPRFVLLEDGRVFTGGTSRMAAGRLEKDEVKELEKRLEQVRKLPGLGQSIAFGDAPAPRSRLQAPRDRIDVVVTGDPASAPAALQPLAALVRDLLAFHHPSLRPYEPSAYAVLAREAPLPGGCRSWSLPVPLADAVAGGRTVESKDAHGWPTGAAPAAVCDGERRFVIALRPLLPGERP